MQNSFEELTQLSEVFLVRTTPLPESGRAWLEIGEPFGGSFTVASASLCRDLLSAKTFPAFYPPMEGDPSEQSSVAWSNSGMACAGGFLTFATSESHSGGGESSLSQVIEAVVPQKFYLSESQLIAMSNWKSQQNPLSEVLRLEGQEVYIQAHSLFKTSMESDS